MNERTASPSPSVLPARLRRRFPQVAAGLVAATAVMAAGTGLGGAAAVDSPADPQLVVVDECVEGVGPRLALVYTNPQGPGVADFETTVNGQPVADVSVLPGGQQVLHVPVGEGTQPVVKVTANGGYSETITRGWTNCWDMSRWVGFECTDTGPRIVTHGVNTGHLYDTLDIFLNGVQWGAYGIGVGEDFSISVPLTEDASYEVKVVPGHSGWSSITGHANCDQPAEVPDPTEDPAPAPTEDPAPEPEPEAAPVPEPTTTTTPPAQVAGVTVEPAAVAAVSVAPSFTG